MKKLRSFLSTAETIQVQKDQVNEDYCAHVYLGNMYMALGRFDLAETEFLRAQAIRQTPEAEEKVVTARAQLAALKQSLRPAHSAAASRAA